MKETESKGPGDEYVTEYTYDKADKLTKQSTNLNSTTLTTDYSYDANGNLTKEKSNYKLDASASVDVDTPDFDFSLDANVKVDLTTVEKSYKYNNENRLTAVKEGGRLLMVALYDGDGERIFTLNNKCADGYTNNNEGTALNCYFDSTSGDGKITYNTDVIKNEILIPNGISKLESINYELTGYINDTNQENTQVLMEYGANSKITNTYTYGINRNSANIGGKDNYYIYDGRGSVSQLTNSNGCTAASYGYDIYGETKTTNNLINNPYKYNAESTDSATGLQYLRARYYNFNNHRFMSKDTYQGDIESPLTCNNYAYANNNPVNYSDPTGHGIFQDLETKLKNGWNRFWGIPGDPTVHFENSSSGKKQDNSSGKKQDNSSGKKQDNSSSTNKNKEKSSEAKKGQTSPSCDKGKGNDGVNSKLSRNYPEEADINKYLVFDNSWQKNIDPVFARRLAAYARDHEITISIGSAYRTYDEQVKLYKNSGGYQDKNGNWVGGSKGIGKPGASWHNFGEAIDISGNGEKSSVYMKNLYQNDKTENQTELLKYGLFKPFTPPNKLNVIEDWHIQPIETNSDHDKQSFLNAYTKK